MKVIKLFFITLTFLLAIGFANELFAGGPPGPPSGGPGGGGPPCWPPPCVPIDGGISYLLALGAIYGGKKIYDISKKAE